MVATAAPVETVLVPVDGSEESFRAVEYGVEIAARYDAGLHLLYVIPEPVMRGMEDGTVDAAAVANETDTFVDDVEAAAADRSVALSTSTAAGFSRMRKTRHPGSVILDTSEGIDADFIVIPREPVTGKPDRMFEKAAEYVLLYASQPVLSV